MEAGKHLKSKVLAVDPENPDPQKIALAAQVILRGGLVAFPTETVYGLGANALDAAAVERVFIAKGRPRTDPLIVHVVSPEQIQQVAEGIPSLAAQLVEQLFPGPLTLIFKRGKAIPPIVSAGLDTVAVRMPDHPVALALIRAAGVPIAAPSANLFTHPSPTTAQHVVQDLGDRVDLILDAGPCAVGLESTVLDLTSQPPRVLRPGGTTVEILRSFAPDIVLQPRYLRSEHETPGVASPGMGLKHYAPQAALFVITGESHLILEKIIALARELSDQGARLGILAAEEDLPVLKGFSAQVEALGRATDLETVGRNLFAALRRLDQAGVEVILARDFGEHGMGLAIRDRMTRAAEGKVIRAGDPGERVEKTSDGWQIRKKQ